MVIKGKPNLAAFLDGGAAASKEDEPQVLKKKPGPVAGAPKRQKLVELPAETFEALKDRAYQEYKATGLRVTETQIIINALNEYLGIKKI